MNTQESMGWSKITTTNNYYTGDCPVHAPWTNYYKDGCPACQFERGERPNKTQTFFQSDNSLQKK